MILVRSVGWHDRLCRTLPINPTGLEDLIRLYQMMKSNLTAPLSGLSPPSISFGKLIDEEVEADVSRDEQSSEMRRHVLTAWKLLLSKPDFLSSGVMKPSLYDDGRCPVSRKRLKTVTKHGANKSTQSFRSHVEQESRLYCLVGALRTIRISSSTVTGSKTGR